MGLGFAIRQRGIYRRVYGWRAIHAVSLVIGFAPSWLGLEPGWKFQLPLGLLLGYPFFMGKSIRAIPKRAGRPVTTERTLIGLRLQDDPLSALDAWVEKQREPDPTLSEAIRRLVELGLTVKTVGRKSSEGQKLRARDMAGKAIDRMADTTAHPDDQASRKHRLLKGPEEFREARVDRLKPKK